MGSMNFVNSAIEKKLMDLHCGYIGKVIWTDGVTAKVQPLGLMKENDGVAKTQAVVSDVPVASKALGVRNSFTLMMFDASVVFPSTEAAT